MLLNVDPQYMYIPSITCTYQIKTCDIENTNITIYYHFLKNGH